MSINYRGMNVSAPEVTTQAELDAFFGFADQPTGRPLESYALWAELRPDMLKRLLNHVHWIHESESWSCPLAYMNLYAVGGWEWGVKYIMSICQPSTFLTGAGLHEGRRRRDAGVFVLPRSHVGHRDHRGRGARGPRRLPRAGERARRPRGPRAGRSRLRS